MLGGIAKLFKKEVFKVEWPKTPQVEEVAPEGYHNTRKWQREAFDLLKDEKRAIVNAPMGSGKSWLMCLLSAYKMKQDKNLRTIIAVPQTIIGSGFAEAHIVLPNGERVDWKPKRDLCARKPSAGTTNTVIAFLEQTGKTDINDRVLLCSHTTLVMTYKKLKEMKKRALLKNLVVWIDESHHIMNAELDDTDATVNNNIGEMVAWLISRGKNVHLGLATATFFRGDRITVLTAEQEEAFIRYNLPWDQYMSTLKYLKSFSMRFVLCGPDYMDGINSIVQEGIGKTIIHIPHRQSRYATGEKLDEVDGIVKALKKKVGAKRVKNTADGLMVFGDGKKEIKVLDLVDESNRELKKDYIYNIKNPEDLDVIIALNMFKEGSNWEHASRGVIVGVRSSLVDVVQMIGRLFRDVPGKEHVEVIQLLPFTVDQVEDREKYREQLNDYLKTIYAAMLIEDVLSPIIIKGPSVEGDDEVTEGSNGGPRKGYLNTALPDANDQLQLKRLVVNEIESRMALDQEQGIKTDIRAVFERIVPEILRGEFGVKKNASEIGKELWARFGRASLHAKGVDVRNIDFDILSGEVVFGFVFAYTSGPMGIDTCKKFRDALALYKHIVSLPDAKAIFKRLKEQGISFESPEEYDLWCKLDYDYAEVVARRKKVA